MASTVNYADSYEHSSTPPMKKTLAVHAKPILVTTTSNHFEQETPTIHFESSKRILSTASLSSTGYDSNSSPSILSKRNSFNTNRSHDFSISNESNLCTSGNFVNSYSSDNLSDHSPLISRSHIKLIPSRTSTLERHPVSVVRHTIISKSSVPNSPSISSNSSSTSAKFVLQTTSFPTNTNISSARLRRKHSNSRSAVFTPIIVQKQTSNQREQSPLPVVENPLFQQSTFSSAPQKPPRTFQHDQKVISTSSSSSASHSPTFDIGN